MKETPRINVAPVPLYSPLIPLSFNIFHAQSRGPLYFAFTAEDACWILNNRASIWNIWIKSETKFAMFCIEK